MRLLVLALLFASPLVTFASSNDWQIELPPVNEPFAVPPGLSVSPLLTVTTDRDANVFTLGLLRDTTGAPAGGYVQSGTDVTNGKAYLLSAISQPNGVAIFTSQGRDVIILQGAYDKAQGGGTFQMRYLTNGLFMTYASCNVLLKSQGQDFWLQNAYTGAKVTATKVLTSTLGVTTLQGICP